MQYRIKIKFRDLDGVKTSYEINDIVYFEEEKAKELIAKGFIEEVQVQSVGDSYSKEEVDEMFNSLYTEYTLKSTNYTWCGIEELSGDILIPKLFLHEGELYKTVTIDDFSFENKTGITSVRLPNSLKSIDNSAFLGCTGLTNIVLPDSVTTIGPSAFNQSKINTITFSKNLEFIGNRAFAGTPVTFTKLPGKNLRIEQQAFAGCTNLTDITLPENVTGGTNAFESCANLKKVTFEGKPSSLHYNLFKSCSSLIEINVPWAEGEIGQAPWGATNATINYNYVG